MMALKKNFENKLSASEWDEVSLEEGKSGTLSIIYFFMKRSKAKDVETCKQKCHCKKNSILISWKNYA